MIPLYKTIAELIEKGAVDKPTNTFLSEMRWHNIAQQMLLAAADLMVDTRDMSQAQSIYRRQILDHCGELAALMVLLLKETGISDDELTMHAIEQAKQRFVIPKEAQAQEDPRFK